MTTLFHSILARLRRKANVRRGAPARAPRTRSFRPQLETLEHRWVPAGTASINGTAFVDLTGNGLSADDAPQQGVQVALLAANPRWGYHEVAHVRTGADGSYSFDNLAPGTYRVIERMPHDSIRTAPATQDFYQVTVTAGQTVPNQDFDNFKLLRTKDIHDVSFTVYDPSTQTTKTVRDLRGHTRQGDIVTAHFSVHGGTPIVVSLAAYDAPAATFSAATASQQVLDSTATGTFSKGGPYSLTVTIPDSFYQIDFVAGAAIDHFGPAGSNIFYSAERRLVSADNGGTHVAAGATITGVVFHDNDNSGSLTAGDTVISGAPVVLVNNADNSQKSTATGTDGTYTFGGLQAGTYTITVTLPGGIAFFSTVTITAGSTINDDFAAPPDNSGGQGS
jgi:hypothetical protein